MQSAYALDSKVIKYSDNILVYRLLCIQYNENVVHFAMTVAEKHTIDDCSAIFRHFAQEEQIYGCAGVHFMFQMVEPLEIQ